MPDHMNDIEALKQLKARYFRLMDTKDWDGLAAVFTDDVHIDMRSEGGELTTSLGAYLPFLRKNIGDVTTVHHGHMPEIAFEDDDHATGIWAMEDELWWPEGAPLKHMHGYGHYHETYTRTADGWRIASLSLSRLRRDLEFA